MKFLGLLLGGIGLLSAIGSNSINVNDKTNEIKVDNKLMNNYTYEIEESNNTSIMVGQETDQVETWYDSDDEENIDLYYNFGQNNHSIRFNTIHIPNPEELSNFIEEAQVISEMNSQSQDNKYMAMYIRFGNWGNPIFREDGGQQGLNSTKHGFLLIIYRVSNDAIFSINNSEKKYKIVVDSISMSRYWNYGGGDMGPYDYLVQSNYSNNNVTYTYKYGNDVNLNTIDTAFLNDKTNDTYFEISYVSKPLFIPHPNIALYSYRFAVQDLPEADIDRVYYNPHSSFYHIDDNYVPSGDIPWDTYKENEQYYNSIKCTFDDVFTRNYYITGKSDRSCNGWNINFEAIPAYSSITFDYYTLGDHEKPVIDTSIFENYVAADSTTKIVYPVNYNNRPSITSILSNIRVLDEIDGDLTNRIKIVNNSYDETKGLGEYPVSISVSDNAGNTSSLTFYVKVYDIDKPAYRFDSADVSVSREFDDTQYALKINDNSSNYDSLDAIIKVLYNDNYTAQNRLTITYIGNKDKVDGNIPGKYDLSFTVSDEVGNVTNTQILKVNITDSIKPIIKAPKSIQVSYKTLYDLEDLKRYIEITDNYDGTITDYVISGYNSYKLSYDVPGIKDLFIDAIDTAGNKMSFHVELQVKDDVEANFMLANNYFITVQSGVEVTKEMIISYLSQIGEIDATQVQSVTFSEPNENNQIEALVLCTYKKMTVTIQNVDDEKKVETELPWYQRVWNAIVDWFVSVGNWFKDRWNDVVNWFKSIFNGGSVEHVEEVEPEIVTNTKNNI